MKVILKAYAVSLDGEYWVTINATSRGVAKNKFRQDLEWDVAYIDIKCKTLGDVEFHTTERFKQNAKYRGIEFAYCGMKVQLGENFGWIVGHNSSANLDVLFYKGKPSYVGHTLNCHPNWKMKYFDKQGNIIKDYEKEPTK